MKAAIWQGFDHFWENDPHRLNQFGSWLTVSSLDADGDGKPDVAYQSRMSIGRFPADVCRTSTLIAEIGSETTHFIDGETSHVLAGQLGQHVDAVGERVSVALPGPGLNASVVMRGFELESVNFPHGFHTRGFGFLLSDIEQHDGDGMPCISFVPKFFIFPDRSPDPATDPTRVLWQILPFPDWMEPKTPGDFEYRMTLYYRIVYDEADKIAFTPQEVVKSARSYEYPRRSPAPNIRAEIKGEPGGDFETATVGLRGFHFELDDWPRTRFNGRYLRKLKFMVDWLEYDPDTGEMTYSPQMLFTNFGVRDGRREDEEQLQRWLAFLRRRDRPRNERLRTLVRLLTGSYGFGARYALYVTLIQFKGAEASEPELLSNVIRSVGPGTRVARSLLHVFQRRRARRAAKRQQRMSKKSADGVKQG